MTTYQKNKNRIRKEAIKCQKNLEKQGYIWGDMLVETDYYETMGKRYGLVKEFRKKGIILD